MEIPEQVYQGCWVPPELSYDVERDVWARFEEDGTVTLGMTDVAQTKAGKLVSILFKAPGKVLRSGQSAATIESAKWVGPFPTPLSGEIVANNEETFGKDILMANRDPYGAGWLLRLKPTALEEERVRLVPGREAFATIRDRIDHDKLRCYRCAD
ncbi:MAG: glycine cleavage system protein H [Candidatus Dormiibacterota bacterium]